MAVDFEPLHGRIEKQVQLPFSQAVEIAWKNIRVRLSRSLLVTSGIILALAFLTYILCSESLTREIANNVPQSTKEQLLEAGKLSALADADAQVRTWWLVGLALLVSFVGILNAMLLSVTERFKEIGTMKCLGALDGLVVQLFLLESAFQGVVGTFIGIFIGLMLAFGEAVIFDFGWRTVLAYCPTLQVLSIVGICFIVGIVLTIMGALYPAWRAARMQPVDAMRSEI